MGGWSYPPHPSKEKEEEEETARFIRRKEIKQGGGKRHKRESKMGRTSTGRVARKIA